MKVNKYYVKENVVPRPPLSPLGLAAALALAAATLAVAALRDRTLPEPLTRDSAPPDRFIAEIAHQHLVNLTSIGPRVAGSYENEVLAVGVIVEAVRAIARQAAPHVRLELDVQRASGAFPLAFLDGMNHVYQDVSNVVVRVSAAGGGRRSEPSLLLNCHFDTVPDSPGAGDDGAGCAVLLETLRAVVAGRGGPRHSAVFLFNGAEENVLQGSHGFITQHKWAKSVRAFINIEACGAGGREVLFQAGPHDPWIVELYAGAVPHPFASSLAQELFESGLIPADTDFRIFRDFGNISGVDFAWISNGYVYHTALDTAERVSPAVLQRTGDNVLALTRGMLASESLESGVDRSSRQPVFFDVLGLAVVCVRPPAALLAVLLAEGLLAALLALTARRAAADLFLPRGEWWRCAARGAAASALAAAAGGAAGAAAGGALHAAGARLAFYARPWLLAPLYALPALAAAWWTGAALSRRWLRGALGARGWWPARALYQGACLLAGGALLLAALCGQRAGFVLWLWVAGAAGAGCAEVVGGGRRAPAWWWAGGAVLPALLAWDLALGALRLLVPVCGRAGTSVLPPDVTVAALTAALTLAANWWLLPIVVASRGAHKLMAVCGGAGVCALALVASGVAYGPYAAGAPQRLMVFHTRRQLHEGGGPARVEHFYWMPQLDVNTPRSVRMYAAEFGQMSPVGGRQCARWVYCGMPYFLPVRSLVRRTLRAPAPPPPAPRAAVDLQVRSTNGTHGSLTVTATGAPHLVLIVSLARGARLAPGPLAPRPLAARPLAADDPPVYFFALHSARGRPQEPLTLWLEREADDPVSPAGNGVWSGSQVSLTAHAMAGGEGALARLLASLPEWVQATGWTQDMHLSRL